jgi:hypothetical protein
VQLLVVAVVARLGARCKRWRDHCVWEPSAGVAMWFGPGNSCMCTTGMLHQQVGSERAWANASFTVPLQLY